MEEGTFLEWRKRAGDCVQPGDVLYVLESDKAAEEIETLDSGVLHIPADSPKPGQKVTVGQVLAYILAEGEEVPRETSFEVAATDSVQPRQANATVPDPVRAAAASVL